MMATAPPPDQIEDAPEEPVLGNAHWLSQFTKEERKEILTLDDRRAWLTLAVNWGIVFGAMGMVAVSEGLWLVLTIPLAICLIAGRQLGCAIVMHEASHRTFLSNRVWNDRIGNWLGAYPTWTDVLPYRPYHLLHHAKTGTEGDPDLSLTKPFPLTKESFRRKVWRDLSGQTGWSQIKQTFLRDTGLTQRKTQRNQGLGPGEKADVGFHKLIPVLVSNGVIFGICWAFGHPLVYLLWVVSLLTVYRLVIRIRAIGEHAMAGPADDPLRNTRTTLASWWERLFLAPNYVNYHLEHHLLMTVPHYNLPKMHRMLKEKDLLEDALVTRGYAEVLRRATSKPSEGQAAAAPA